MNAISKFLTQDPDIFLLSGAEVSSRNITVREVRKPRLGRPIFVNLSWAPAEGASQLAADVEFNDISDARRERGDSLDLTLCLEAEGGNSGKGVLDIRIPFLPSALGDLRFGTVFSLSTICDRPEVVGGAELCLTDGQALRQARRMPAGAISHLSFATRLQTRLVEPGLMLRLFLRPFEGRAKVRIARGFVGQDYDPYLFNPYFERQVALYGSSDLGQEAEAKAEFLRHAHDAMALHDYRGGQCFLKPFVVTRGPDPEFPFLLGTPNSLAWYGQSPIHHSDFYHRDGLVRPGDTVLDCGAHAGELSTLFARTVGSHGRVISFDPFPQNFLQVKAQAILNSTPWLEAVEAGVGASHATVPTELELQMTIGSEARAGERSVYPLKIVPLDDYTDAKPSFIKVDVEGAEAVCLAGAQRLLRRHRPMLYVEVHPLFLKRFGQTPKDFFDTIPTDLYRVQYKLEDAAPGWHDYEPSVAARFEGKVGGYVRALPI